MDYTKLSGTELPDYCGKDSHKWAEAFKCLVMGTPAHMSVDLLSSWFLLAINEAEKWRDMADAPDDGSHILAYGDVTDYYGSLLEEGAVVECFFENGKWYVALDMGSAIEHCVLPEKWIHLQK